MDQIHKRFTAEQVKVLFKAYCQGILDRVAVQETLGIGKARFFALLKQYRCKSSERKDFMWKDELPPEKEASPPEELRPQFDPLSPKGALLGTAMRRLPCHTPSAGEIS